MFMSVWYEKCIQQPLVSNSNIITMFLAPINGHTWIIDQYSMACFIAYCSASVVYGLQIVLHERLENCSCPYMYIYTVNQQKFTVKKSSRIAKTASIKRTKAFNRIHCNT